MDDLNNNENDQNNQAGYYPNNSQDPYSANSGFGPVNPYMNNQDGSSFNPYGMADSNSMPQNPYQNSGEFNPAYIILLIQGQKIIRILFKLLIIHRIQIMHRILIQLLKMIMVLFHHLIYLMKVLLFQSNQLKCRTINLIR